MILWRRVLVLYSLCYSSTFIDCNNDVKVWGPGLDPGKNILPANYFFISNLNVQGSKDLEVNIQGGDASSRCRLRTEVLSDKNGLFIVRYKIYYECPSLVIHISSHGHPIVDPIQVAGPIYPAHCHCPMNNIERWLESSECKKEIPKQMSEDLAKFQHGVYFLPELKRAEASFNNSGSFAWCHYVIKDGEIFRRCYGEHVGFSMFWDAILKYILRRTQLPDLQFMANLGDWPLIHKKYEGIPMFSWCGRKTTQDIIFPTYELTESSLEMLGRQSLDVLAAMGKNNLKWEDKKDKLFWKGRDSRRERLDLVKLSQKNPELINASITNFFFFRSEMNDYGGGSKSVPFFQFFDYKYQLNVDGTVAAYRFPFLLSGNSVVFKQDSEYYEHFYSDLLPWVHYVPVNTDLSNLVEMINWAKDNDDQAQQIVSNAQKYVLENLLPHHVFCYHVQLLHQWSKLLKDEIIVREGMSKVNLESEEESRFPKCSCDKRSSETKQEL